jgi:RNA repair pathway DNA polymerase beta family
MIPEDIRTEILRRMHNAEKEHGVRILLAVESGSRAWGFESPNSDFDARFIYVHPRDWYLSVGLEEQPDVIEYPIVDDIDLNGWDLRKALRLFWKSNPPLFMRKTAALPNSPAAFCPVFTPAKAVFTTTAVWLKRISGVI